MKKKLTKKSLIFIVVCVIAVLLLLVFAPFPKRVHVTLQGARTSEGEALEPAEIEVDGWRLNYLFRGDKFRGKVTVTPVEQETDGFVEYTEPVSWPIFSVPDRSIHWSDMMRYSAKQNQVVAGTMWFTDQFDKIMVEDGIDSGYAYVAASDSNVTMKEVYDLFNEFKVQ